MSTGRRRKLDAFNVVNEQIRDPQCVRCRNAEGISAYDDETVLELLA